MCVNVRWNTYNKVLWVVVVAPCLYKVRAAADVAPATINIFCSRWHHICNLRT